MPSKIGGSPADPHAIIARRQDGDDPDRIAHRLPKEYHRHLQGDGFNRRLVYPKSGVA
jgi:hypothetical protein